MLAQGFGSALDDFYPRPPRGGRPRCSPGGWSAEYFYPRPPRGGRRCCSPASSPDSSISIHALREEGDCAGTSRNPSKAISIHALREEGDDDDAGILIQQTLFLSTPSARRATKALWTSHRQHRFLSTPSARRATLFPEICEHWIVISIHALREEGDSFGILPMLPGSHFYPRPPRGGRRVLQPIYQQR